MRLSRIAFYGLCVVWAISLFSCKKKTEEKDTETDSASDNAIASSISNDMVSISDEAGKTKSVSSFKTEENYGILSTCATLKFDTLVAGNQDTITVKFGTINCTCADGRTRRGDLIIIYTGKYKDSLTTITVQPQNYFVNDNQVNGTKTIKNKGHNSAGHLVYDVSANLQITKPNNGGVIIWNCIRQREWVSGESTLLWYDDIYWITGTASGSSSNGSSFTSTITNPLVRNMQPGCRKHFVMGTIVHTPAGKPDRILDYGAGGCDNDATVTINGEAYNIKLP